MNQYSDHRICADVRAHRARGHSAAWWRAFERCVERGLVGEAGFRITEKGIAFLEGIDPTTCSGLQTTGMPAPVKFPRGFAEERR